VAELGGLAVSGNENRSGNDATSTIHLSSLNSGITPVAAISKISSEDRLVLSATDLSHALLIGINAPSLGYRFLLDQAEQIVGRGEGVDIFLDDVTVSRKHALIAGGDGIFSLTDLGSLNGTYCNGASWVSGEMHNGDEIQIGKFRFVFLQRVAQS
jgi:pSer/pThr/pTyr-binding forkhead associated (FHA) protein